MTVLVDDVRSFRDARPCEVARTAQEALTVLRQHLSAPIDELWLDHDLGRAADGRPATVMPVVEELVAAAATGQPYDIGEIVVHSSNPTGALAMRGALTAAGYRVHRSYDLRAFVNRKTEERQ